MRQARDDRIALFCAKTWGLQLTQVPGLGDCLPFVVALFLILSYGVKGVTHMSLRRDVAEFTSYLIAVLENPSVDITPRNHVFAKFKGHMFIETFAEEIKANVNDFPQGLKAILDVLKWYAHKNKESKFDLGSEALAIFAAVYDIAFNVKVFNNGVFIYEYTVGGSFGTPGVATLIYHIDRKHYDFLSRNAAAAQTALQQMVRMSV